jgi:hypothetical protein
LWLDNKTKYFFITQFCDLPSYWWNQHCEHFIKGSTYQKKSFAPPSSHLLFHLNWNKLRHFNR